MMLKWIMTRKISENKLLEQDETEPIFQQQQLWSLFFNRSEKIRDILHRRWPLLDNEKVERSLFK